MTPDYTRKTCILVRTHTFTTSSSETSTWLNTTNRKHSHHLSLAHRLECGQNSHQTMNFPGSWTYLVRNTFLRNNLTEPFAGRLSLTNHKSGVEQAREAAQKRKKQRLDRAATKKDFFKTQSKMDILRIDSTATIGVKRSASGSSDATVIIDRPERMKRQRRRKAQTLKELMAEDPPERLELPPISEESQVED